MLQQFISLFFWTTNQRARLALTTILNAKHGSFSLLAGIVCSSWTTINMATSGRTTCTPLGREDRGYVRAANQMASRSFAYDYDMLVS